LNGIVKLEQPQTVPASEKSHQRNLRYSYKTAHADLVIGTWNKKKVCSVTLIFNKEEGNGNGSKLIKYIEGYARQCRCKEVWYPNVLNPKLALMLIKRGFELQKHQHEIFGEVEVFVKELRRKI